MLKKNSSVSYFEVKETFDYLQYTTEPFRGKPRTCDLYSAHSLIYQSFQEGLQLVASPEQWKEIIDILSVVSNGTTTSIQRSIGGPLATDALFKLLSEFADENNRSHINGVFEAIAKEKEEYHLHSDIAEYNFRLAALFGSSNEKDKALSYFRKGVEYILGYTMRKDLTLVDVIHGLKYYALVQPEKALEDLKKTRVLVDSAVEHTDGKETHHFPVIWFGIFLEIDFKKAALFLLHELSTSRYDWRAEKSLIDLLCAANGNIDPVTEFYIASTFPLNDSEKFINYCLNLHEILQPLNPSFTEKLMARIIPFAQPRQNKSLSEKVIDRVNEKIESGGYNNKLQVPRPDKYRASLKRKWYIEDILERKEFSSMSDVELIGYFEEKGIQQGDVLPLTYLFSQLDELTEARKQIIQTIVTKNNRNYSDKIDIDIIFETQNEIECYYWICRFIYDVGGWFEKFVNEAAFQKAHVIAPTKTLDYLFELLPSQLDIGFNFEFSSNLIKALIKVGYDEAVISSMWNNLFKITNYRLPAKEEIEWDSILGNKLEMDTEEILICIMICRYRAATTERFRWTTSALDYFFQHKQDKLIKPIKWFFSNQSKFLDSVLVIILQLLLKQKERGNLYHSNFNTELSRIFPKHHFLIDYIIAKLVNIPLPRFHTPTGLIYPPMKDKDYDFFVRLNRRFKPIESCGINLEKVFSKYVASIKNKYGGYFELYWNRAYEQGVPNVYTSDYLLELVNRELYREFAKWGEVENEVVFKYASLIDIDAIICHINSFSLRPYDLPKPYELDKPYLRISNFERGEWIRLGHYEIALKKEGVRKGSTFKSFGGIVFSDENSNIFPYSNYSIFPFHIWSDINPQFELDKTIVFALLQEDSLEYFELLWLNPTLVRLLELTVKNTHAGLIGVNSTNEVILKMRTWSCDYIGDDYRSSLSDEIPRLQGTDLIIRKDYFSKLSNYFSEVPTYCIMKWELPKKQIAEED